MSRQLERNTSFPMRPTHCIVEAQSSYNATTDAFTAETTVIDDIALTQFMEDDRPITESSDIISLPPGLWEIIASPNVLESAAASINYQVGIFDGTGDTSYWTSSTIAVAASTSSLPVGKAVVHLPTGGDISIRIREISGSGNAQVQADVVAVIRKIGNANET